MSPRSSYLYVVEDERGRCKIGHGKSPKSRRSSLATGNADALTLAFKARVEGRNAVEAEAVAHAILAGHRVRGEWFSVSKSVAAAAARMGATGDHHPELISRMQAFDAACAEDHEPSWEGLSTSVAQVHRTAQAVEDIAPGLLVAINSWNELHLDAWREKKAAERVARPLRRRPAPSPSREVTA